MAEKTYTLKATNTECRFDIDELGLSAGSHTFVVKAKADGYKDSDYSNEVSVTVGGGYTVSFDSTQGDELLDKGDRWNVYIDGVLKGGADSLDGQSFTGVTSVKFEQVEGEQSAIKYTMGGETFFIDNCVEMVESERTVVLTADLTVIDAWS